MYIWMIAVRAVLLERPAAGAAGTIDEDQRTVKLRMKRHGEGASTTSATPHAQATGRRRRRRA